MKVQVTSVFDIEFQEEQTNLDYKKLYLQQRKKRIYFERRTKILQIKLKSYAPDIQKAPSSKMIDMRSFKNLLPNSVHFLPHPVSNDSLAQTINPPIIKQWAIYGVPQIEIQSLNRNSEYQGSLIYSSKQPTQLVQHAAKLVFPSGVKVIYKNGLQARQKCMQITNFSLQKYRAFVLSFQSGQQYNNSKKSQVIQKVNPQGRIFAIGIQIQDFTLIAQGDGKVWGGEGQEVLAGISPRIICIFSDYPFFSFFQQILKGILQSVKIQRYDRLQQGGDNLWLADSLKHSQLLKNMLQLVQNQKPQVRLGQVIKIDAGCSRSRIDLSANSLQTSMAEQWAFPILSLFTLDTFLDIFSLVTLQQKVIFVCKSMPILTMTVFLFAQILIRPFSYPYPVVSIIPDQQDYLNAPFPLVYGLFKDKQQLIDSKIPKQYRNIYVVIQPTGIQIITQDKKDKLLSQKSPKLRDRLIPRFKKMKKNMPKTTKIFSFISKKSFQFDFVQNSQIALDIISEVQSFLREDILKLLPNQKQVQNIKKSLSNMEEQDQNPAIFAQICKRCKSKSKDPYFPAFLNTQLANVFLFKY